MSREVECGFPAPAVPDGMAALFEYGPTLPVRIGFDQDYRPGAGRVPALPTDTRPALIDTGAHLSCIDSGLAIMLGLPTVDRESVSGVHGPQEVNIHLAQIYIPEFDHTIYGRFHGVHLVMGGQPHQALIGRWFLRHCVMEYNGPTGSVKISLAAPPAA